MAVTTQGGKQSIDPAMPSGSKKVIRDDDIMDVVSGEL